MHYAPPAPTGTAPAEIATRPEPGLARGKWEAPAWVFWAVLGVVLLASVGYVLYRLGYLTKKKARGSLPPPSLRSRR